MPPKKITKGRISSPNAGKTAATKKETYASPAAKKRHEAKETPAKKASEKKLGKS